MARSSFGRKTFTKERAALPKQRVTKVDNDPYGARLQARKGNEEWGTLNFRACYPWNTEAVMAELNGLKMGWVNSGYLPGHEFRIVQGTRNEIARTRF